MATKGGFDPDNPLPFFLRYDEPELGIGYGRAVMSARFVMASILVATATATGISILSAGNPVTLFADVTASLADKSAPQPTDQSAAIIQPVVIQSTAEALPLTAQDVPTREINDPEPASQTKMVTDEASSEALFREFQAWSAEQDARGLASPYKVTRHRPRKMLQHPCGLCKSVEWLGPYVMGPSMEQAGLFIRKQKSLQGNRAFLALCPSACLAISDLGHPPAAPLAVTPTGTNDQMPSVVGIFDDRVKSILGQNPHS